MTTEVVNQERTSELGVVAHSFNPSTQEAEVGGFRDQRGLQSEFQDNQDYTEKPCLEKPKKKKKKKNQTSGLSLSHSPAIYY
jgi:hypothetical protein